MNSPIEVVEIDPAFVFGGMNLGDLGESWRLGGTFRWVKTSATT
jgi:hypothetical protein